MIMRWLVTLAVCIATLSTLGYCQIDNCLDGKADIVIALDGTRLNTPTEHTQFVFMKEYIKKILNKITLNFINGTMVSLFTYGTTSTEIADFSADKNSILTKLQALTYPRLPTRYTNLALDHITEKFKKFNRRGVPRIAIIFVNGNTNGDFSTLKLAAKRAAISENIQIIAVSANSTFAVRDLDTITSYVPGRIISAVYRDDEPDMAAVCQYMIGGTVLPRNCTGKAHVILGIDLSTKSRFDMALNLGIALFSNVRQVRRTLLLNDANNYEYTFAPGVNSISEFGKIQSEAASRLNSGSYDARGMVDNFVSAFNKSLLTTMHMARVAILISDQDSGSATQMRQAVDMLRNQNIKLIIIAVQAELKPSLQTLLVLTEENLQNQIVTSDTTLSVSGLNQVMNSVCYAIQRCPGEIDVMIAMDTSYSIASQPEKVQLVKAYTKIIANSFIHNRVHAAQIAIIAFGTSVFHVSFFGDNLIDIIENINLAQPISNDYKTNTDIALDYMINRTNSKGRPGVPKVAIIVTDGKSTNGLQNLQNSAIRAAMNNLITVAVGVGDGYIMEELSNLTNGIQENIIESTFEDLTSIAASKTVDRLCLFAIDGQGTSQVCEGAAHITIAVDVGDAKNFDEVKLFAAKLIANLKVQEMLVSIVIGSTGAEYNFPANTDSNTIRNTILRSTNSDTFIYNHTGTINRAAKTFAAKPIMPRIVLFITDGKSTNPASSIAAARIAATNDIQFLALGLIKKDISAVDMNEITGIAGGIIQNRFVISEEGLQSSGVNLVIMSVCHAISDWSGTSLLKFMGPAEVSLMMDSCDRTMHNFYRAFAKDVLRYINVEDNKVKLNVASFCSKVEPISSYQDMYYIHPSLKYENIMANKQWTASQIIGDYILHFNDIRSSNKIGIVLVNDATIEPNLGLIAQYAYQQGITLFAIGIDYGQQNLEMKLAQISPNGYMKLPLNQLNVMGMNFLITNFMAMANASDRYVAMGLVGFNPTIDLGNQSIRYNHLVTSLQGQTRMLTGNIRNEMDSRISNAVYTGNGLAIHDAIANFRRIFKNKSGKKYAFIVTNKGAENIELVNRERELAKKENITIYVIGFKPDVTLDQLVAIAGSSDLVSYYESSNRLIQMSSRFVQLVSEFGMDAKLAFAIAGTGMSANAFSHMRNVVVTAANLYKQLSQLGNKNIELAAGLIGYNGFYLVQPLTAVSNINLVQLENSLAQLANEPLAQSMMNMYFTLSQQKVAGRPQYAVVFYSGGLGSNKNMVLKIAQMMRDNGITVIPYNVDGISTDVENSAEYKDAVLMAGGNANNVMWLSRNYIRNNQTKNPIELSGYLKNNIMNVGNYGCNVDVSMGQMGDLDPSALKEVRKIIAAFIGTSEQDCRGRMKMGVFEFDQTTYAPLIHFGLHSDYASLQNAFQTQSDIRTAYPRGSAAIQYIINSLSQNQQSDMVKAGVLLVDDEVYSKYETLIKAYNAYARGMHVIVMSVSQAGSLLSQQDKVNMANGVAANTFTVNNIASLNTDGKAYLINILGQLNTFNPVLTTTAATTTSLATTTKTTTTTTTTQAPTTTTIKTTTRDYNTGLTECLGPADIAIALDSSDSLQIPDFQNSKDFVNTLVFNMRIGVNNIRLRSVFTFSTTIKDIVDDVYDKNIIRALLQAATMLKIGTNTHLAIQEIRLRLQRAPQIPTNPQFGIIITDGKSAYPALTKAEADLAYNQGITMFVVGIVSPKYSISERQTMIDELYRIAANIISNVIVVQDFDEMLTALPILNTLICNLATTTTTSTTVTVPTTTPQFANECITRCDPTAIRCYVPHPTNCKYYLDCVREAGATQFVQYSIQECGLHYFFNPDTSKCDHLDEFICKQDPCVINKWTNGTTYPVPNSCNLYYKCQHTKDGMMIHTSQACQCENKLKYDTTISGTDDHDHCIKDTTNACSIVDNSRTTPKLERCKRFKIGDTKYIEDGEEKECVTGKIFKSERCSCVWGELPTTPTVTTTVKPTSSGECIPSIHLDFSTILSTNPQLQGQDNVQVANGKGYFGGLSFIANPQLNNNIMPIFIAKLKLKMDTSFSFGSNSLLKSCSGNPMASIQMYAERNTGNTKNKLITKVMISDFRPITVSNDKYDIYDNKEVTITLGFNREMVAVEVALSAVETDLQQVAFSNAPKDFLACNGALNVGQPFGGNGPFVGDIYDWKVWNGCDNVPTSMEYLFN